MAEDEETTYLQVRVPRGLRDRVNAVAEGLDLVAAEMIRKWLVNGLRAAEKRVRDAAKRAAAA